MKVLLVKPPSDMHVVLPPIGLGYLASSLKKSDASFEVSIVDCLKQGYGVVRFRQYLERAKPDVVGFTAFTMEIASALKCAAAVKDYNPGIITIVGGAHVSAAPQEVLGNRNIDFIFRGEREHLAHDLVVLDLGGFNARIPGLNAQSQFNLVRSNLDLRIPAHRDQPGLTVSPRSRGHRRKHTNAKNQKCFS